MAKWYSTSIVKLGVAAAMCRVRESPTGHMWVRYSWLLQGARCWHSASMAGLVATAEYMRVHDEPARHDASMA